MKFKATYQTGPACKKVELDPVDELVITSDHEKPDQTVIIGWSGATWATRSQAFRIVVESDTTLVSIETITRETM